MGQTLTKISRLAYNKPSQISIIVFVSLLSYCNALGNGFVYDDIFQVIKNPWIRNYGHIGDIFTSSVWAFNGVETNYYRPMMHIFYLAAYQIFGLVPWGFHLMNVILHVLNSVLVFCIACRLLEKKEHGETSAARFLPLTVALLFAAHPIHTEVVTWVGGMPDAAFSFFSLLSLFFYIRCSSGTPLISLAFALSVLSYFLATLCKEPALTILPIMVAYDYAFRGSDFTLKGSIKKYTPFAAATLIYFLLRISALSSMVPLHKHGDLSLYQDIVNVFPLFATYLEKLVLPINLNAWHVFHPISSLFTAKGLASLIVTLAFFIAIILTARKNKPIFWSLLIIILPHSAISISACPGGKPFCREVPVLSFGWIFIADSVSGGKAFPEFEKILLHWLHCRNRHLCCRHRPKKSCLEG